MKPSRAPIETPTRPPPPAHRVNPAEQRLWLELDRGQPLCPWCGGDAQRVVKVGKAWSHCCWTDHP